MIKKSRRIAILHDYFDKRGGGERLVLTLAKHLKADIFTAFIDKKNTYPDIEQYNIKSLGNRIKLSWKRPYELIKRFQDINITQHYDIFIFSGTYSIFAAKRHHPNIWYCHTPARHIYSQKKWFMSQQNIFMRPLISLGIMQLRKLDQQTVRHIDTFIANSLNVKGRIERFYPFIDKPVKVIYPPIEIPHDTSSADKGYFLSYGRVDTLKRIPLIVEAFQQMPQHKLVVASGGPLLQKVKNMAKGFPNITVRGYVTDSELKELLRNCTATIYIPIDEDFGMTPLEGMAYGKPCIGVDEGGLKETIIHGKTGWLCKKNPTIVDIQKSISSIQAHKQEYFQTPCRNQAHAFSTSVFIDAIERIINTITNIRSQSPIKRRKQL